MQRNVGLHCPDYDVSLSADMDGTLTCPIRKDCVFIDKTKNDSNCGEVSCEEMQSVCINVETQSYKACTQFVVENYRT